MSSCALWYKDGTFFDVETTHVNFFLNHPDLLGFAQEEKEFLCVKNGLGKCFGDFLTVKDTLGWGMDLNNIGWGNQIKDFIKQRLKLSLDDRNEFCASLVERKN